MENKITNSEGSMTDLRGGQNKTQKMKLKEEGSLLFCFQKTKEHPEEIIVQSKNG